MVTFAFVYLVEQGHVRLAMGKTGRIIKRRHVLAERTSTAGGGLGGVEGQSLGATLAGTKKNDVPTIVWRLWSSDVPSPVGDVIQMGKAYLRTLGYFHEEERGGIGRLLGSKWVPDCDRILALREAATSVQGLVAAFRSRQPDLYGQLWKDVGKGISARQEAPDIDDD